MGKHMHMDCFIIGRSAKASKLKPLINLATCRLSVLKNQRLQRCNLARSDVLQLLQLGHHERALLRVENVIKEQNMLDVYATIEGYFNLLVERLHLIEEDRICPEELKEAISGLLYASSRCGDFPELQEIRTVFTAHYGKEFAARAIELRNNCGVSPTLIKKLSTRHPEMDIKMRVLKEIASENDIVLELEEASKKTEEKYEDISSGPKLDSDLQISSDGIGKDGLTGLTKTKKRYKDVADAAQAAFESAAYAAEAARAAVELSRYEPHGPDNQDGPNNQGRKSFEMDSPTKPESDADSTNQEFDNTESKINNGMEEKSFESTNTSNSNIIADDLRVYSMSLDPEQLAKQLEKDVVFYDSDGEQVVQEAKATEAPKLQGSKQINREKGYISVRTKGARRN